MLERLRQNIVSRALLARAESVLVAVSGGIDSVVLLEILRRLAPEFDLNLAVAHFNHQLRGAESDADEEFVRRLSHQHGLPFRSAAANVKAKAAAEGISIEMSARALRHAFLANAASEFGAKTIVLAHHADDQVETFWLRLLRGEVGRGLGAMRWVAPSPADPNARLIRPLLNIPKEAIHAFAAEHALGFREDSSNAELHFQRNRLRHEVLPALERYQPALREISLRIADILAEEKEFLQSVAAESAYQDAHPAIQREILRQRLRALGVEPTAELIERLRLSHEPLMIAPQQILERGASGELTLRRVDQPIFREGECVLHPDAPGTHGWAGVNFSWTFAPRGEPEPGVEYFDAAKLGPRIILRHWRPGDRFQPIGLPQPVKLQDIFTNLKISEHDRRARVLATTQDGTIFWVEGLRLGDFAKVTPQTIRALKWSWRREPDGGCN